MYFTTTIFKNVPDPHSVSKTAFYACILKIIHIIVTPIPMYFSSQMDPFITPQIQRSHMLKDFLLPLLILSNFTPAFPWVRKSISFFLPIWINLYKTQDFSLNISVNEYILLAYSSTLCWVLNARNSHAAFSVKSSPHPTSGLRPTFSATKPHPACNCPAALTSLDLS